MARRRQGMHEEMRKARQNFGRDGRLVMRGEWRVMALMACLALDSKCSGTCISIAAREARDESQMLICGGLMDLFECFLSSHREPQCECGADIDVRTLAATPWESERTIL